MAFDVDRLMRLWDGPGEEQDFRTAYADPVRLHGRPVPVTAVIDIFTIVDGLITEVHAVSDELGLLTAIDAVTLTRTA